MDQPRKRQRQYCTESDRFHRRNNKSRVWQNVFLTRVKIPVRIVGHNKKYCGAVREIETDKKTKNSYDKKPKRKTAGASPPDDDGDGDVRNNNQKKKEKTSLFHNLASNPQ